MTKEEMIKQLEEARGFIGTFYSDTAYKVEVTTLGDSDVDIDTEDVTEADDRIEKVLAALKGDKK